MSVEFRPLRTQKASIAIFDLPPSTALQQKSSFHDEYSIKPDTPYSEKGEKVEQSWKGGDSASYRCRQRYQRWHTQYGCSEVHGMEGLPRTPFETI
jgi:hypothetical protein